MSKMNMPGFTAEASLKTSAHYSRDGSAGPILINQGVTTANIFGDIVDWFKGKIQDQPSSPAVACGTDTKCYGVSMWCNNWCEYPGWPNNIRKSSGWHPCGVCFGFDW